MRKILLGTALTLCFSAPAFAQVATMDVKDAANATRTINTNPGRGSGLAANSMMVVLPTDQTPIPVTKSGTWAIDSIIALPPLAAGSNLIGSVSQSGAWNVTNITGTVTLPTGAATSAAQTTANTSLSSIATNTTAPTSLATGQITCASTSTQVVAARAGRKAVTIQVIGTTATYVGVTGVTTSTGFRIPGVDGASQTIDGGAGVFCVVASGTAVVHYVETF